MLEELFKAIPQGFELKISHGNNGIYLIDINKENKYAASVYFTDEQLEEVFANHDILDKIKAMVVGINKLEKQNEGDK